MHKKVTIVIMFFLFAFFAQSQNKFNAGVKMGFVASQVDGDTYGGYHKFGIEAGGTLNAKINEKWQTQFEILYIQKGSKHVGDANKGDYSYYLLKLNYIEVPLLIKYKQKKITYEAGPGLGFLLDANEVDSYGKVLLDPFHTKELNANFGVNYQLNKKLSINCRFSYSLFSIQEYRHQLNNVLAFTLHYSFINAENK